MASALELWHVSAGYGETVVIEDIDLTLAPGECISVIGRNGVGKTTLLATVMGHNTLHSGDVMLGGQRLNDVPSYRRALAGIGFVPQEREIFRSLSVCENLTVGARPVVGRLRAFSNCSQGSRNDSTIWAISSQAASSRCYRSRARC